MFVQQNIRKTIMNHGDVIFSLYVWWITVSSFPMLSRQHAIRCVTFRDPEPDGHRLSWSPALYTLLSSSTPAPGVTLLQTTATLSLVTRGRNTRQHVLGFLPRWEWEERGGCRQLFRAVGSIRVSAHFLLFTQQFTEYPEPGLNSNS